jgi:hypothetical protein
VQFSVSGPGADAFQKTPLDLGAKWPIPQVPPAGADYEVRLHGIDRAPYALLSLEGGEAMQLAYDKVQRVLTFPPYEPRAFDPHDDRRGREQSVEDRAGGERFTVQGLLPQRVGQDVLFFVYVQREQPDRFTPRPRHVWAEIRPLGPLSNRVYYFSDVDFVPDRPVPVFRFLARHWPREAKDAEINLWFKFAGDAAQPEWEGPVDPLRPVTAAVPSLPGVQFEIRSESLAAQAYRVVVTERQAADRDVTPARVQIQPPPDERILHSFFAGVNVLKHEFKYAAQKPATVSITSRDRILRESLEAKRLQVPVED